MALFPEDWTLDLLLPAASKAHNPSALEVEVVGLFDQVRDRLLRYILSFGVSIDDGEEIVQDVFLLLFRHLQLGRPRTNLQGWVFRVAHNLALKQCHAKQKLGDTIGSDHDIAEKQLDPAPSPEEGLAHSQRRQRLLAVFRALPEQDQRCLRLRAEGLKYRDIAQTLGVSLATISLSLTRSLERLARADER